MPKTYFVKWHHPDAGNHLDMLTEDVITATVGHIGLSHEMVGPDGDVITAVFDIEPLPDGKVLLRYGGSNAAANKAADVYRGDVRLDPSHFGQAKYLDWRDEGTDEFEALRVTIWSEDLEGSPLTRSTTSPRRSKRLKAIKQALGRELGRCEACGSEGHPGYGNAKHACFEVHHRHALAHGERITGLGDLVYICANCHRVITALGEMPFDEFVARLDVQGPSPSALKA